MCTTRGGDRSTTGHEQIIVTFARRTRATLSAGVLAWLLRGGALIAGMISVLPVWARFDHLPVVLVGAKDNDDGDDMDDEEVTVARILDAAKRDGTPEDGNG